MTVGRPTEFDENTISRAHEYIAQAHDYLGEDGKWHVNLPKIEGLALHLGISRQCLYEWKAKHEVFGDIVERVSIMQAERVINGAMEGKYNPSISKLLLTKHGYRDAQDVTSDDKPLPTPIYGGKSVHDSGHDSDK